MREKLDNSSKCLAQCLIYSKWFGKHFWHLLKIFLIRTNTFVTVYSLKSLIASHFLWVKNKLFTRPSIIWSLPSFPLSSFLSFLLYFYDLVYIGLFQVLRSSPLPLQGLWFPLPGMLVPQLFTWLVHPHPPGLSSDITLLREVCPDHPTQNVCLKLFPISFPPIFVITICNALLCLTCILSVFSIRSVGSLKPEALIVYCFILCH